MINPNQINDCIKKASDPSFDFEKTIYQIFAKLTAQGIVVMDCIRKVEESIIKYVKSEWGNEKIDSKNLMSIIIAQSIYNPHYQKMAKFLNDDENFYLQTSIIGSISKKLYSVK